MRGLLHWPLVSEWVWTYPGGVPFFWWWKVEELHWHFWSQRAFSLFMFSIFCGILTSTSFMHMIYSGCFNLLFTWLFNLEFVVVILRHCICITDLKQNNAYLLYNGLMSTRSLIGDGIYSLASSGCQLLAILIGQHRMVQLLHMHRCSYPGTQGVFQQCKLSLHVQNSVGGQASCFILWQKRGK